MHNQYIPCDQAATQSILTSSKITSLKPAVPSYRCLERILAKLRPHHPQLPHCCPQNTPLAGWHQGVSSAKTDPAERTSTYLHSQDQTPDLCLRSANTVDENLDVPNKQCRREMEHHSRRHLQLRHGGKIQIDMKLESLL